MIVAQPAWTAALGPALAAGTLRYEVADEGGRVSPRLGLILKAAMSFAEGDEARLIAPPPPCFARASELPGAAPEELAYPSDYVPERDGADVLLHGHAYAELPSPRIEAAIAVADVRRSLTLVAGGPAAALPLSAAYLREADGQRPAPPAGPVATPLASGLHVRELLPDRYASAAPGQRAASLQADAVIEMTGLSRRARRRVVRLPALAPQAVAVSRSGEDVPFELRCDTLWIDTDREELVLVWRGAIPLAGDAAAGSLARIDVWMEATAEPRSTDDVRQQLQRGHFAYAREEDDAAGGELPPPIPEDELREAKLSLWDQSPEATLPMERYAQISAELQEKREPRAETLRRHGLDEDGWGLEERAVMEGLAAAAMGGDAAPANAFGLLFLAAQEALAAPEEAARGVAEYAEVKAAMDAGADPSKVLAAFAMTLPVWMRLDRRMHRAALADPALRDEIEARTAAATVDPKLLDDEAFFAAAAAKADEDEEDEA